MLLKGQRFWILFFLLGWFTACKDGADQKAAEPLDSMVIDRNEIPNYSQVIQEPVEYLDDDQEFKSFMSYSSAGDPKKPIVLVIPEWWGVTDYIKSRLDQLAQLGYFAMAVDLYGGGKVLTTPEAAGKEAAKFYNNITLAQQNFDAAMAIAKSYSQADTSKVAVIGYCFGGTMALNMARLGERLKGVVSFHGDLDNHGLTARKGGIAPAILVCHGSADSMVPEKTVTSFKKEMETAGAQMQFIAYPNAKHAFTNPDATAIGQKFKIDIAYNEAADRASWEAMKLFLDKVFR